MLFRSFLNLLTFFTAHLNHLNEHHLHNHFCHLSALSDSNEHQSGHHLLDSPQKHEGWKHQDSEDASQTPGTSSVDTGLGGSQRHSNKAVASHWGAHVVVDAPKDINQAGIASTTTPDSDMD